MDDYMNVKQYKEMIVAGRTYKIVDIKPQSVTVEGDTHTQAGRVRPALCDKLVGALRDQGLPVRWLLAGDFKGMGRITFPFDGSGWHAVYAEQWRAYAREGTAEIGAEYKKWEVLYKLCEKVQLQNAFMISPYYRKKETARQLYYQEVQLLWEAYSCPFKYLTDKRGFAEPPRADLRDVTDWHIEQVQRLLETIEARVLAIAEDKTT